MLPRKRAPRAARRTRTAEVHQSLVKNPQNNDDSRDDTNADKAAHAPPPGRPSRPPPRKRKGRVEEEEEQEEEEVQRPSKKTKPITKPKKNIGAKAPLKRDLKIINKAPDRVLDIFVFGEGSSGELGLGARRNDNKKPIDVKRPRINHNLDSKKVGVVQVACGGMHALALARDNKIYTWGVNDDGALGRDTVYNGNNSATKPEIKSEINSGDSDSDSDDDDDTGLNPLESTPGEVVWNDLDPGTIFCQVAATDSASFALTVDGRVYGWGTFRGSDGIIGFTADIRIQPRPMEILGLKSITKLACGSNHVIALDVWGRVFTWGSGGQFQLGRKATTRHEGSKAGLRPESCSKFSSKKYAVDIGAGSYHSFFIDNNKEVWGWGLNNYSQTGHGDDCGQDDAMVLMPRVIDSLSGLKVAQIAGGEHHTVACTKDGELLTWGRIDGNQVGHKADAYTEENTIFDDDGRPRILKEPTRIDGMSVKLVTASSYEEPKASLTRITGINAAFVAAGTDTSFVIDDAGRAYSWGFSANYQTGQGTDDDIDVPTLIANTAVKGRQVVWAGAGGQYSVLAAETPEQNGQVNGQTNGSN